MMNQLNQKKMNEEMKFLFTKILIEVDGREFWSSIMMFSFISKLNKFKFFKFTSKFDFNYI